MKITEIVIDRKKEANFQVLKNFTLSKDAQFSIDRDGYVSASGTITLTTMCKKLPVKFKTMVGNFVCRGAGLEILEGCPEMVLGNFHCDNNNLTNLINGPIAVKGEYNCSNNPLTSTEGIATEAGAITISYKEHLPLIRLMVINGVKDIRLVPDQHSERAATWAVDKIIKKYVGQGKKGALLCAVDLIRAGFKENAKR